jgi:alkyldihydroxyacetonephosphate synthase
MAYKTIQKDGLTLSFTSYLKKNPELEAKRAEIHSALSRIVGEGDVVTDESSLLSYKYSKLPGGLPLRRTSVAQGDYTVVMPDFAVYPETTEEVQEILKLANNYIIPVVPFAGGSGLGITAPSGGIILDLKKLDRIIEIDEISHTVTVEAGIYVFDLENELNKRGWELEHYPASYFCSCIGGFIGDRSAGRLSTKYGKIEKMVLGMKVVLPNGKLIETPKVPGHAVGPDLNNLFIGMGGTIGVTTEVTLKIYPTPEKRTFRSVFLPDLDNGFEAMRKIMQAELNPCMARLYDHIETNSQLFKYHLLTDPARETLESNPGSCYLIYGFDGREELVDLLHKWAWEILQEHGAIDLGFDEGQFWWDHSLDDYYKGLGRPTRKSEFFPDDTPHTGGVFDYIVPMKYIGQIWKETTEALKKEFPKSIMYGHFSHWYKTATMMYPMVYIWDLPDDPAELAKAYYKAQSIVFEPVYKYGGAFQHHHGVGRIYALQMPKQWGEGGFEALYAIKEALDPNNIMNPGNLGFEVK